MNGLTWFWPALVATLAVALALAGPVSRSLRTSRVLAWILLASVGLIVAATLTPIHGPTGIDLALARPCDLERRWFASWPEMSSITDVSLNIALFIPLGLSIAWLPRSRATIAVTGLAIALPFVVEGLQFLVPSLARGCQSGDVIDNLTGLVIGLGVGALIRLAFSFVRGWRSGGASVSD